MPKSDEPPVKGPIKPSFRLLLVTAAGEAVGETAGERVGTVAVVAGACAIAVTHQASDKAAADKQLAKNLRLCGSEEKLVIKKREVRSKRDRGTCRQVKQQA